VEKCDARKKRYGVQEQKSLRLNFLAFAFCSF